MHARLSGRLGAPASGVVALIVAGGLGASPAAATPSSASPRPAAGPVLAVVPPQEPGVTLRVFDLQVSLRNLCTLRPSQTPNVDKLMPVIDFTSDADFGIPNRFASQVIANLNIATAGSYDFRLISDDGSRLSIDGQTVINHDGQHGPTPRDGARTLTTGYHALRIDHFEADYGQRLTLQWKPPGATSFVTVPNSVLSTDAGVVRVTSPGRKECATGGDSPGDGLPVTGVHPNYTLTNLRAPGFEPKVSGMDWFSDGRMVISTWGGSDRENGEVWVLGNVTGNTTPGAVTRQRVATGLKEPMGVKVVDGKIYVSEKDQLTELNDTNGDGVTDQYRSIATWPFGGNFHEFGFGLLYRDGFFYLNLSVAINYHGDTTNPQPAPNRGTTIKVNRATGAVQYLAGGLRTPHGIGWGPEDGIFVTDNQGSWLPSSKLVHIKQGRFFNHFLNPAGPFDSNPVTPPVLWLPHEEISLSPSQPTMLTAGPFAGQMVIGDVTYGGLQRAYLEKVGGEYQGAAFRMTQGLESGITRVTVGPDGALYVGGLGAGGNWGQPGKLQYGLQKLAPNGTQAFDILAMRARPGGFEFEYTKPVSEATAANLASRYTFQQWRYAPTSRYGGPKVGQETLNVTSASLSADRKKVTVQVAGLRAGHVVHARSPRPFTSTTGDSLWSTEAWYTLNTLVTGSEPGPSTVIQAEAATRSGGTGVNTNHSGYTGTGFVDGYATIGATTTFTVSAASAGARTVTLRYANGPHPFQGTKTLSLYVNGAKVRQVSLASTGTWATWADHTEAVTLTAGSNTIAYRLDSSDSGHVNLDKITVTGGGGTPGRITLFDGSNLDAWERLSGNPASWPIADGSTEVVNGDIRTRQKFQDFRLHVEFLVPQFPPDVTDQRRGNSGVYLQERYEIQVLDSFGDTTLDDDEAGGIYSKRAPDSNQATAPGTWQSYDITFRAARFNASGVKTENARTTVVWNGVTVHNNVEINGVTGGGIPEGPTPGSVRLQDHYDPGPNVRYRNMWIEPIS